MIPFLPTPSPFSLTPPLPPLPLLPDVLLTLGVLVLSPTFWEKAKESAATQAMSLEAFGRPPAVSMTTK